MKFILLFFFVSTISYAAPVNLARHTLGESRVNIDLKNFAIFVNHPDIRAKFISDSLRWERNFDNLLIPKVLIGIAFKTREQKTHIIHDEEIFIPVNKGAGLYSEMWIDLFNPGTLKIIEKNKLIDEIRIESIYDKSVTKTQLIDYSCSPYKLEIKGLEGEYLSAGCVLNRIGKMGKEVPRLEVSIATPNYKLINGERSPYKIIMEDNAPAEFTVINYKNEERKIVVTASLPKRLHRLKTAFGFGPYIYSSYLDDLSLKNKPAPSIMLYGKFDLTETSSFKFFDALLYEKSAFNNAGLYFSYDLAEAFDGRIVFNTLLGFQGLYYKFNQNSVTKNRFIYPQGFELLWKHPFERENEYMTYGMFFSTSKTEDYTNAWVRWGKKNFLELNYIRWKYFESEISMWGISVGIPLIQAF